MKVSPRVPVHGGFAGFAEMRYVRLGAVSKDAAFFVRLFEEARRPYSRHLRGLLETALRESPSRQHAACLLQGTEEEFVNAWNSSAEDLLSSATHAVSTLILQRGEQFSSKREFNREVLGVEELNLDQPHDSRRIDLYVGCIEGGVVLLYRHYAMESFVVTPCGHMYLKYALFAAARKPHPQSQSELSFVLCWCGTPLGDFVFALGREAARMEPITPVLLRKNEAEALCACCRAQDGECECVNGCPICKQCAAAAYFSGLKLRCPVCAKPFQKLYFDTIMTFVGATIGPPHTEVKLECAKCRGEKRKDYFVKCWVMQHECLVCDVCVTSQYSQGLDFSQCLACRAWLPAADVEVAKFKILGLPSVQKQPCLLCNHLVDDFSVCKSIGHACLLCNRCQVQHIQDAQCQFCIRPYQEFNSQVIYDILASQRAKCPCGRKKTQSTLNCSRQCLCPSCHFTKYLLTRSACCPLCFEQCTMPPQEVQCSSCMRKLLLTLTHKDSVAAVCSKGCVLCPFCVEIRGTETHCSVCSKLVESAIAVEELRELQELRGTACGCRNDGGQKVQIECGHFVHIWCAEDIARCLQCGVFRKTERKRMKINNYL